MTNLKAFHNDEAIKQKYVERIKMHRELDQLVQGTGWETKSEDGGPKGCAVGCTLENYDHKQYEVELGIPEWLARVEDTIFEGLETKRAMDWPQEFLEAINPGANLESVKAPFLIFVLQSTLDCFDHSKFPDVKQAIESVVDLYIIGGTEDDFRAAADAADAARAAADAAAYAAAAARAAADAAAYAAAAARAAGDAAAYAAAAARAAGDAAAAAAYAAAAARAADEKFADKLLELLRECK